LASGTVAAIAVAGMIPRLEQFRYQWGWLMAARESKTILKTDGRKIHLGNRSRREILREINGLG
jgi:hypothetical protein